jgi:hypothetical protein
MSRRYFPVTAMAGRLFNHSASRSGEFSYLAEEIVDGLLKVSPPRDRKIQAAEELLAAMNDSIQRPSAMTLWVAEGMEDDIRASLSGTRRASNRSEGN